MARAKKIETPKYLVKETQVEKATEWSEARTVIHWLTVETDEELEALMTSDDRPGCGSYCESIRHDVFTFTSKLFIAADRIPITPIEVAVGPPINNKVILKETFRNKKKNLFTLMKPPPTQDGDDRFVSDQDVMLVAVATDGEIRWTVTAGTAHDDVNIEAVEHYGLTWRRDETVSD